MPPAPSPLGPELGDALTHEGDLLPTDVRRTMEESFGHGFGDVRVHTGPAAERAAGSLHAAAFTVGSDIWFGSGMFAPRTHRGSTALAHELAHVIQQEGARGPVEVGEWPELERQAFAAAVDPRVRSSLQRTARPLVQRLDLNAAALAEPDIDPRVALASNDFIDNAIAATALREEPGPKFVSYTIVYTDGSAIDIPIDAQWMRGPVPPGQAQLIRYRRHAATGKIFPIVWRGPPADLPDNPATAGEIFVAKDLTPNILARFDIDLVARATEFARDIMAIWAAGLAAAGAIQVFSAVQVAALRSVGASAVARAASAAAARAESQRILADAARKALIAELRASGAKFTEANIVRIFRTASGKIAWLERGTESAGLKHIMTRHASNFADLGVKSEQEIVDMIERTLATKVPARPAGLGGEFSGVLPRHDLRIVVGDNGFVVTAYPL